MCALVTGVQTCALPIYFVRVVEPQAAVLRRLGDADQAQDRGEGCGEGDRGEHRQPAGPFPLAGAEDSDVGARKSVVKGTHVSVLVALGGRRTIYTNTYRHRTTLRVSNTNTHAYR